MTHRFIGLAILLVAFVSGALASEPAFPCRVPVLDSAFVVENQPVEFRLLRSGQVNCPAYDFDRNAVPIEVQVSRLNANGEYQVVGEINTFDNLPVTLRPGSQYEPGRYVASFRTSGYFLKEVHFSWGKAVDVPRGISLPVIRPTGSVYRGVVYLSGIIPDRYAVPAVAYQIVGGETRMQVGQVETVEYSNIPTEIKLAPVWGNVLRFRFDGSVTFDESRPVYIATEWFGRVSPGVGYEPDAPNRMVWGFNNPEAR